MGIGYMLKSPALGEYQGASAQAINAGADRSLAMFRSQVKGAAVTDCSIAYLLAPYLTGAPVEQDQQRESSDYR
jgi:hypothetical protein